MQCRYEFNLLQLNNFHMNFSKFVTPVQGDQVLQLVMLQVELGCTKGKLDISYVVTLYPLSMATALIVRNTGTKPVELTSAVLSHIKFDKRNGTAVEGLRGCPYSSLPPPAANFAILTPAEAMKREDSGGWFSGSEEEPRQGVWVVEENQYTILKKKVSRVYAAPPEERKKRIYSTAPSKFITIDQVLIDFTFF